MNSIIQHFEMMCDAIMNSDDGYLMHYGRSKRDGATVGSGRYPLGSGDVPYQHVLDFYNMVAKYRKESPEMTYTDIARAMGMTTTVFKKKLSNASEVYKRDRDARVLALHEKGYSQSKIEEMTGVSGSTIRNIINPAKRAKTNKNQEVADKLREYLKEHDMIDIGPGTELALGISKTKLKNAAALLEESGEFKVHQVRVEQMTGKGKTNILTLAPADYDYNKDILPNADKIQPITDTVVDVDGNILVGKALNPTSVDSKRVCVRYADEGGLENDGVIEIRRGNPDLDLGNSHYAQVRIAVDGTHYLKGVARYSDEIPPGYDIMVESNKAKGTPLCGPKDNTVAKPMKKDPANPFGASIKEEDDLRMVQKYYYDPKTGEKKLSALNIVNEEGTWEKWTKSVASQTLSKEDPALAKRQLDISLERDRAELDSIMALTNPTVKRQLLEDFSNKADAAARDLKAAAFPGQRTRLLMPCNTLKDNECYCEDYENGTTVYAIRYPHGGTFETAELTVNNNNKEGRKYYSGAVDAIGVTMKTRQRLSGADCDGDTVIVIPKSRGVKLRTSDLPKEMEDFDPHVYKLPPGKKPMTEKTKEMQMGVVTNLITDMTIKIDENVRKRGYITQEEQHDICQAVKASMVAIDAVKHELDYYGACRDLGISQLKKKYQYNEETGRSGGASTLLSRAKNPVDVPERYSRTGIYTTNTNPETGEKIWKETGHTTTKVKVNKETGRVTVKEGVLKTQESTQMDEHPDARSLSSGTLMESIYADYANGQKAMANEARKAYLETKPNKLNKEARIKYAAEVASLEEKLKVAKRNAPLERHATAVAATVYKKVCEDNPHMTKDDKKKLRGRLMVNARDAVGAGKKKVNITDREWEAIQADAISSNTLQSILKNADPDRVRQLATPRDEHRGLTPTQIRFIKNHIDDYGRDQIAEQLGVSTGAVNYAILNEINKKT